MTATTLLDIMMLTINTESINTMRTVMNENKLFDYYYDYVDS
jgi:hypothetical protein